MAPPVDVASLRARRKYRDRDDVEVAILDALVGRHEAGMTVFELRSRVDVNIETLEPALNNLRDDGLITVEYGDDRSVIRPEDRVLPSEQRDDADEGLGESLFRRIRDLLGR